MFTLIYSVDISPITYINSNYNTMYSYAVCDITNINFA